MASWPANADAWGSLTAAADAGPYFVIEPLTEAEAEAKDEGWQPATLLVSDPAVLTDRVTYAREVIAGRAGIAPAEVAERVAASIVFLGLASRLVSPSLGAAVLGGVVPYLTLEDLWWRPVNSGPLPLAAGPAPGREIGSPQTGRQLDAAAALLTEHCVQGMAVPLVDVFQRLFRLSPLVLRGNIASALAGAAGMLASSSPDQAETAAQLTGRMLALEPLRGTGDLVQPDSSQPRRFLVRRSCCLYYRIPGGGICGDCVLTPEHIRRQQWQAALSH